MNLQTMYNRGRHKLRWLMGLEERKKYFDCLGVTSHVLEERKDSSSVAGHVLMFDVEDKDFRTVKNYFTERFDVVFIFESSLNNYHVLIPEINSFEETYNMMLKVEMEHTPHTEIGYKRGDWVLRVSDKPDKPKPVLRYADAVMNKDKVLSYPHLMYVKELYGDKTAENCLKFFNTEGDRLKAVKYSTFK